MHIQGYRKRKAFIIAQNPMESTRRVFWKVICDNECHLIVTLDGEETCYQYWPEIDAEIQELGEYLVDHVYEQTYNGFIIRNLRILDKKVRKTTTLTAPLLYDANCRNK